MMIVQRSNVLFYCGGNESTVTLVIIDDLNIFEFCLAVHHDIHCVYRAVLHSAVTRRGCVLESCINTATRKTSPQL